MARKKKPELTPELSHEHDTICAYLASPETQLKLLDYLSARHMASVGVALASGATVRVQRERPVKSESGRAVTGYVDVEIVLSQIELKRFLYVQIEVKSGVFSVGDVARQLGAYRPRANLLYDPSASTSEAISYLIAPEISPAHAAELAQVGIWSLQLGPDYDAWRALHANRPAVPTL